MLRHVDLVEKWIQICARRYGVRIHRFANVGNHLHLLVSLAPESAVREPVRVGYTKFERARARFSGFLRELAGAIAFRITGASKSKPVGRFWDAPAFTRILHWGREFERGMIYLVKNLFEAAGLWNRKKNPHWEVGWG